ncbi:hypothetical protein MMC07_004903 [Pseudocyphellaria aurata]|nr:hypothetical protein [Pseudocyphellaria aurata]
MEGGCLCGRCTTLLSGEPQFKALCYCKDCQKISGSTYSTNLFVATDAFRLISGTPKQYRKLADSGNTMTSHLCGDCGTTLWRESSGLQGLKIVKEGTLDTLSHSKPTVEYYPENRIDWVPAMTNSKEENEKREEKSEEK